MLVRSISHIQYLDIFPKFLDLLLAVVKNKFSMKELSKLSIVSKSWNSIIFKLLLEKNTQRIFYTIKNRIPIHNYYHIINFQIQIKNISLNFNNNILVFSGEKLKSHFPELTLKLSNHDIPCSIKCSRCLTLKLKASDLSDSIISYDTFQKIPLVFKSVYYYKVYADLTDSSIKLRELFRSSLYDYKNQILEIAVSGGPRPGWKSSPLISNTFLFYTVNRTIPDSDRFELINNGRIFTIQPIIHNKNSTLVKCRSEIRPIHWIDVDES